ncbi:MAG: hypothetical protein AAB875_04550 [Patescibacteria group bacterium]
MAAEIVGELLGDWEGNAVMGGDEPGLVRHEHPLFVQEKMREVEEEERNKLIPKNRIRGLILLGPLLKHGNKVLVVYKQDYSVKDFI